MMNYTNTTIPIQNTGVPQLNQQITFQQPSFFPQPIGNVYNLTSAAEIGNIPASTNLSIGLCLAENLLYIKCLQNGAPMVLSYKLNPLENGSAAGMVQPESKNDSNIEKTLQEYDLKIKKLEEELFKINDKLGGKLNWQI
jgi:hypothetical protein